MNSDFCLTENKMLMPEESVCVLKRERMSLVDQRHHQPEGFKSFVYIKRILFICEWLISCFVMEAQQHELNTLNLHPPVSLQSL